MFKVCGVFGISKIDFFNFSGIKRIKQNQITLKSNPNKSRTSFSFFTKNLTLLLPVARCAGHNSDLSSNSSTPKNDGSKHCFPENYFQRVIDKLSNDIQVDRFGTCGSLVIDVLVGITGILKIESFNFSGTRKG